MVTGVAGAGAGMRRRLADLLEQERVLGYVLVGPVVILLLALVAYPFAVAIGYALSDRTIADPGEFVGLENFFNLWESQIYRRTLRNTCLFTIGSVTIRLVLGVALALMLNEVFPCRRLVRASVLLPWIVPTVLGTMAWLWMFNPNFSVINWVLVHAGLASHGPNWLTDPDLALFSVTLVNAWRGTPFMAIVVLAGLQAIPSELYEAATIDGAGKLQRFRHVTLPLVMPVMLTALVLSIIWTFSDFGIVYGLTKGGPMNATHVLATLSYETGLRAGNIGEGAAISLTMLPALLALIVWQLRRIRRSAV
ncbi:MAG: carbohydrate ABC transporter permease [Alphaproteobacteria bacterium]